jgi:hypothetical protein
MAFCGTGSPEGDAMTYSLLLTNIGSLCLGISLSIAVLFHIGGRRRDLDGAESCLGMLLCFSGVGIALACYVTALSAFL